jgi:hypothetical protein
MRIGNLIFPLLLLAMMNLAAIEYGGEASASAAQRSPSSDGATVSFGTLKNGDTVPPTFTVTFMISGMGVAAAGTNIENTGHHHLLIDIEELPDLNQPLPKSDKIRHFGDGQTEVVLTLAEGQHSLQLVFADYMHRPHDPVVVSEKITVTVSADAAPTGKSE